MHLKTCPVCHSPHEGFVTVCQDCLDARSTAAQAEAKHQHQQARAAAWAALCPPGYQGTRWDHPGLSPALTELAHQWWPRWDAVECGLGLWGRSGVGKTRCAYTILRRLHFAGFAVKAVDAFAFSRAVQDQWADDAATRRHARALLQECQHIHILLLDDLGKERMRADSAVPAALHEMVEIRKRHRRPLLWTSERTGAELAPFFGSNYAEGLLNRIREISHIVEATPPAPVML